ncbi:hypothetical protein [Micromonospora sp. NPDC049679]
MDTLDWLRRQRWKTRGRRYAGERDIFHDPEHPSAVFLPLNTAS